MFFSTTYRLPHKNQIATLPQVNKNQGVSEFLSRTNWFSGYFLLKNRRNSDSILEHVENCFIEMEQTNIDTIEMKSSKVNEFQFNLYKAKSSNGKF